MRTTKKYLHYHLGCQFVLKLKNGNGYSAPMYFGIDALSAALTEKDHHIDPIFLLRPIDTMTEDEAVQLAKLTEWEPHFNDVKVERNKVSNDIIVSWQGANESREVVNATGDMFYCYEQIELLLSLNFDVFDLIQDELAFDINKFNK